jgi:hypothetical protein
MIIINHYLHVQILMATVKKRGIQTILYGTCKSHMNDFRFILSNFRRTAVLQCETEMLSTFRHKQHRPTWKVKLPVAQLITKILARYLTRHFDTVFTASLSWARWIHFTLSHHISLRPQLQRPVAYVQTFPSGFFQSGSCWECVFTYTYTCW